ncbi:hypothetical protein LJC42_00130 [Eubacteriales bacterium OttesenSCG-928-K08]|nr:hypothetical protein [Eubacteriales bacterium OttesenSCG-928-K08]
MKTKIPFYKTTKFIVIVTAILAVIIVTGIMAGRQKTNPVAQNTPLEPTPELTLEDDPQTGDEWGGYGELLEMVDHGDGMIILKYSISSSYNNKATIQQNYHTVENFIQKGNGGDYTEIQYWAVSDEYGGDKVISFTLDADLIQKVSTKELAALNFSDYVLDLWIHESLR